MLKGEELVRNCKETGEPIESKTCLRLNITKQICSSQGYIISKEDFIFDLNLELKILYRHAYRGYDYVPRGTIDKRKLEPS